jgi:hypothetical protein
MLESGLSAVFSISLAPLVGVRNLTLQQRNCARKLPQYRKIVNARRDQYVNSSISSAALVDVFKATILMVRSSGFRRALWFMAMP